MGRIHAAGQTIHIYGASTKGNVLLQWYGINSFEDPVCRGSQPRQGGRNNAGYRDPHHLRGGIPEDEA